MGETMRWNWYAGAYAPAHQFHLPTGDKDEVELVCRSICSCTPVPPHPCHQ